MCTKFEFRTFGDFANRGFWNLDHGDFRCWIWEKAFDKVWGTERLWICRFALERLNIPPKNPQDCARRPGSADSSPSFRVKHDRFTSEKKVQNAGIRQGCPLSPYLFILVMTVMFRDIHRKHHRDLSDSRIEQITFNELLYADDTLLISKNTRGMNKFLHAIEEESAYYGLRLNQAKWQYSSHEWK